MNIILVEGHFDNFVLDQSLNELARMFCICERVHLLSKTFRSQKFHRRFPFMSTYSTLAFSIFAHIVYLILYRVNIWGIATRLLQTFEKTLVLLLALFYPLPAT